MSLAKLKKGDTVILHMFTGIAVGVKEIIAADKTTVTLETRIGEAKFNRKTGKQVDPEAKKPRFANYITEDDGSYNQKNRMKEAKEKDEDKEDIRPVRKSKKVSKKPVKKTKKARVEEEEDEEIDEDEYEEE